jgi:biopolymer transport protein TolQ
MNFHTALFADLGRTLPSLVFQSGLFAKFVILVLFVLSVISWAVIYDRTRLYLRLRRGGKRLRAMITSRGLSLSMDSLKQCLPSIEGALTLEAKRHLEAAVSQSAPGRGVVQSPETTAHLKDLLDRTAVAEIEEMEKYLVFLATTVAVAPFLGLLGTVWGITDSFMSMGAQGTASIEVVGPGIAEALITTIAGLATAIPALVGYNLLLRHVRRQENATELFISRLLDMSRTRVTEPGLRERETAYEKNPV